MTSRLLFFLLPAIASASMAALPIVWTAPSLSRIGWNDAPGTSRTITIYAAKGESESFQIGVRGPVSHVNVTATDFTLGSKAVIERSNITLYREHYITITNASSRRPLQRRPGQLDQHERDDEQRHAHRHRPGLGQHRRLRRSNVNNYRAVTH